MADGILNDYTRRVHTGELVKIPAGVYATGFSTQVRHNVEGHMMYQPDMREVLYLHMPLAF